MINKIYDFYALIENTIVDYYTLFEKIYPPNSLIGGKSIIFLLAITILIQTFRARADGFWSVWFFYVIGTFWHELAHFLVALVTRGAPCWISIIPKKEKDGIWTLGYVETANSTWYNQTLIALAPLLLYPFSFFVEENFFRLFELNYFTIVLYYFTLINIITSAIPSYHDFKLAIEGLKYMIFTIFFIVGIFFTFVLIIEILKYFDYFG